MYDHTEGRRPTAGRRHLGASLLLLLLLALGSQTHTTARAATPTLDAPRSAPGHTPARRRGPTLAHPTGKAPAASHAARPAPKAPAGDCLLTGVVVPSPNVTVGTNQLLGVAAVAANDVWAVGSSDDPPNEATNTLIEHWDGSAWTVVASPNVGPDNTLYAVTAQAAGDVWAVGAALDVTSGYHQTLVEHWDGSAWTVVASPNGYSYD